MGLAAKEIAREPQPPSSDVLHSLLHVINNEVRASSESRPVPEETDRLDLEQLIEVLMLTRDAINEQIKGASANDGAGRALRRGRERVSVGEARGAATSRRARRLEGARADGDELGEGG